MNSRVIAAIAAAVLAIVGIGAVVVYAAGAQNRAFGGATLVSVYRTTADIGANASSDEVQGNIEEVRLPTAAVPKGAIRELSDISGLKTTVPLIAGEVLVAGRFDEGGSSAASGSAVPEGLQEITVSLPLDAAGSVTAGIKVGVILMAETDDEPARPLARMVAREILVTGVADSGEGKLVTLATNGKLATEISGAARWGGIRLTVQNDDTDDDGGNAADIRRLVK